MGADHIPGGECHRAAHGWLGIQRDWPQAVFHAVLFIFTGASFLCGLAPSLGILLFFRVVQGAGGGGLQPMAQAIMADSFEPSKRGLAFSLYGLVAVLAPSIGPTIGGWLTDNYSWHWIFYINIPIGIARVLPGADGWWKTHRT